MHHSARYGVLVLAVAALHAAPLQRLSDGRSLLRTPVVLEAPAGQSLLVEGGTLLTWNRAGRVITAHRFDRGEFESWSGGRSRLTAGQQMMFVLRQEFAAQEDPDRGVIVVEAATRGGERVRVVRSLWTSAEAKPDGPAEGPRFEVFCVPDKLEGLRLGRTHRSGWGFSIWLQETGGVPVKVTDVAWVARTPGGAVVAEGKLDAGALANVTGGSTQCGPDGVLAVPGQRIAAGGEPPRELAVMVAGTAAGAPIHALGRFVLEPAEPRPAQTLLRMPFRGTWRVFRGPGDPPFYARLAYSWLFDRVDGKGQFYAGDGQSLRQHYAYDQVVLAPARGVLVRAVDMFADGETAMLGGLFSGATGENYVVIDHRNGEYSYLSGFKRGSLRLRQGQTAETGQELGTVGSGLTGVARPSLLYRLVRWPNLEGVPETLEAQFGGWRLADGGGSAEPSAPETGDLVKAP